MLRLKLRKLQRIHAVVERMSNAGIARSTTSEIESEGNAAVAVAVEEEGIAGEAVEEMTEIEIMEVEDLIVENPDIRGLRADATQEIEDHSAHLYRESRIHMFLLAARDADEMTAEGPLHRSRYLLRQPGQDLSHVHHLDGGIGLLRDLARRRHEDVDLGRQIDVPLHTEEEAAAAEGEVRIVELVEDHLAFRPPVPALHDHPSEDDLPHPHR